MGLRTKGFEIGKRLIHFDVHRLEHAWLDQFDYEEKADDLLARPLAPPVVECLRKRDGALVRYDSSTGEFGILHATGFKWNPAKQVGFASLTTTNRETS